MFISTRIHPPFSLKAKRLAATLGIFILPLLCSPPCTAAPEEEIEMTEIRAKTKQPFDWSSHVLAGEAREIREATRLPPVLIPIILGYLDCSFMKRILLAQVEETTEDSLQKGPFAYFYAIQSNGKLVGKKLDIQTKEWRPVPIPKGLPPLIDLYVLEDHPILTLRITSQKGALFFLNTQNGSLHEQKKEDSLQWLRFWNLCAPTKPSPKLEKFLSILNQSPYAFVTVEHSTLILQEKNLSWALWDLKTDPPQPLRVPDGLVGGTYVGKAYSLWIFLTDEHQFAYFDHQPKTIIKGIEIGSVKLKFIRNRMNYEYAGIYENKILAGRSNKRLEILKPVLTLVENKGLISFLDNASYEVTHFDSYLDAHPSEDKLRGVLQGEFLILSENWELEHLSCNEQTKKICRDRLTYNKKQIEPENKRNPYFISDVVTVIPNLNDALLVGQNGRSYYLHSPLDSVRNPPLQLPPEMNWDSYAP